MKKLILSLAFLVVAVAGTNGGCQKVEKQPGRAAQAPGKGDPAAPPTTKIPAETCDEHWAEFSQLQPQGRKTTYQETHQVKMKGQTLVLSQSLTQKEILENTSEKNVWKKRVEVLAPETGHADSETTMNKIKFVELCGLGVHLSYSDRPSGFKPSKQKEMLFEFNGNEYSVVHEQYSFSRSSRPTDKDELELWIGAKAPYKGVLFLMQRRFFKTSPVLSENLVEKQLIEWSDL